ncbi:FAD-dependent oxidoreductase [Actinoplanes siamensis]|uniref:FAD-binding monooxygenase n=1 Tax=Actinoplanes siamensis TaxID=1223317 RepID=A0A919NA62_9ACTN|nr:FAD-dependent oxidoreductase [Actinoplanes siamensis]GIF07034.1 FAD-binding monooxygenase [Actinoplanes siamensis]
MAMPVGQRAVVIGGSVAGLLAARVLADAHAEVVIVDRDELTGRATARRGVPHGSHVHGLLARGQQVIEELLPGFTDRMVADGAPLSDLSNTVRWYFNGRRLQSASSGLTCVAASRPMVERHLREAVARLANVTFLEGRDVDGLVTTADRDTVVGVRIGGGPAGAGEAMGADLVVDASGRGSRTPAWLAELGYPRPAEDRVKIDLTYTTRRFRLRSDAVLGPDVSINPVSSPSHPRGAFFTRIEDGLCALSLTGVLGDRAPADLDGFLAWTRSLPVPEIHDAVRDAEPVGEATSFRYPVSVRRRYDRLATLPQGLLVMGDALCSFNPVYGQGMSVAALEALALRDQLRSGSVVDPRAFYAATTPIVDLAWGISAGADLAYPQVAGRRTAQVRLMNAYLSRLQRAAVHDGQVTRTFMRVAGLVEPPQALMSPGMLLRVLRHGRRSGSRPAGQGVAA